MDQTRCLPLTFDAVVYAILQAYPDFKHVIKRIELGRAIINEKRHFSDKVPEFVDFSKAYKQVKPKQSNEIDQEPGNSNGQLVLERLEPFLKDFISGLETPMEKLVNLYEIFDKLSNIWGLSLDDIVYEFGKDEKHYQTYHIDPSKTKDISGFFH